MNVFELVGKITLDTTEYESSIGRIQQETSGGKLQKGLQTVGKVGAAALGAASAAASAFGVSSVKTGMQFDASMSQIAATLGMTTQDIEDNVDGAGDTFQALRKKALQMGSTTNYTAKEAADGLNILAMSGYDAEESMSMIEDVLHLAGAGAMDMGDAAAYVSGSMKGFNDRTKTSGYYANLMAKGATLANTNVKQLGEALSTSAAGANAYGQSADSVTISLLRLAEQGEVGSAAGTALAAAMKNLYAPTDQAKKALDELGVAAYDSSGKSRDFNTVVNELDTAMSGYTEEQKAAYLQTIFGIQGMDAYNKMTVTGVEKQNEWAEAIKHASDGMGEAATQYSTQTNNLKGDMDILNSSVDGLKIALSDALTPAIRGIVQGASDWITKLSEWVSQEEVTQTITNAFSTAVNWLGVVFGIVSGFISNAITILSSFVEWLNSGTTGADAFKAVVIGLTAAFVAYNVVTCIIKGVLAAAAIAQRLLNAAMNANPIGLVIGLVTGLIAVLVYLYNTNETVREVVDTAWAAIQTAIGGAIDAIVGFWNSTLKPAFADIAKACNNLKETFLTVWETNIQPIVQAAIDAINTAWTTILKPAFAAIASALNALRDTFKDVWETNVKPLVNRVFNGIKTVWDTVLKPAFAAIASAVNALKTTFTEVWQNTIGPMVDTVFSGIKSAYENYLKPAFDGIGTGIESAKSTFTSALNKMKRAANTIWNGPFGIHTLFSKAVNKVKGLLDFEWKLPKPKLPKINWSWTSVGGLLSIPTFSISWNARGYDFPLLFKTATALGGMGYGDRGAYKGGELVYSHDRLMQDIAEASGGGTYNITFNISQQPGQSGEALAREIQRQFVRWENQRKAVYA